MNKIIAIYNDDEMEQLVHITDTIEGAAAWIGCSSRALYKAMHIHGIMKAKGYKIEFINVEEGSK